MLVRNVDISSWHNLTIMDTNNHAAGVCGWIKKTAVVKWALLAPVEGVKPRQVTIP